MESSLSAACCGIALQTDRDEGEVREGIEEQHLRWKVNEKATVGSEEAWGFRRKGQQRQRCMILGGTRFGFGCWASN